MPNWCQNQMIVYGSPTEIKDFYQKLDNAVTRAKSSKHWDLYEIFVEYGYKEEEILHDANFPYIRGYICDIYDIEHLSASEDMLRICYDSAWGSMYEGFDFLLNKHYKTLKQVTLAEECGNEVFINTDIEGRFFNEKYYFYVEDYDTYYCESDNELVNIFNSYLNKNSKKMKSVEECIKHLEKNQGNITKDTYACICSYSMC